MVSKPKHEMQLTLAHPSGAEEWSCPECGRRFVVQWEPKFRRVILENGQEETIHVGRGMGFLSMDVNSSPNESPELDSNLQDIWKDYLDTLDFDAKNDEDPPQ